MTTATDRVLDFLLDELTLTRRQRDSVTISVHAIQNQKLQEECKELNDILRSRTQDIEELDRKLSDLRAEIQVKNGYIDKAGADVEAQASHIMALERRIAAMAPQRQFKITVHLSKKKVVAGKITGVRSAAGVTEIAVTV